MPGRKRKAAEEDRGQSSRKMWGSGASGGASRRKGTSGRRGGGHSPGIDEAAISKMFNDILDDDSDQAASLEGISNFCTNIGIENPEEDIRVLVLLWKLGAEKKPSEISREEWMQGCRKLQLDSISKFQSLLPALDTGFLDRTEFREFYKFCFQFNRAGTHKTLEKDLVVALLPLCASERIAKERLDTFCVFLETTKDESYSRITLDQWRSFLDFCYECEDLKDYDEATSAWPVLIDEYVEFMEGEGKNKKK